MREANKRFEKLFKDHVATLTKSGNIKILDFKKPDSGEFRIRFLFEEDYHTLHISGDLGYLTAVNNSNMVYDKFERDFANNIGYFKEKIRSHERPLYFYSEDAAREDVINWLNDGDLYETVIDDLKEQLNTESEEEALKEFVRGVLYDFSEETGISESGQENLEEYDDGIWEIISDFGKRDTDILEIYMLAFKMAKAQIDAKPC